MPLRVGLYQKGYLEALLIMDIVQSLAHICEPYVFLLYVIAQRLVWSGPYIIAVQRALDIIYLV